MSPEEVAAKLTKAQREHLEASPYADSSGDRRTSNSLIRRGLCERKGTVPNRYMPAWPLPAVSPTPLGLAVRKLLEAQP